MKILIIDTLIHNIRDITNILKDENYEFSYAVTSNEALKILDNESDFDLILLDISMVDDNGVNLCKKIKSNSYNRLIPIIFLTNSRDNISDGFALGAIDYIMIPICPIELISRIKIRLELNYTKTKLTNYTNTNIKTTNANKKIKFQVENNQKYMFWIIIELLELFSNETGRHTRRVAEISSLLAGYLPELEKEDVEIIYYASLMHDIGKMTIPLEILHKQGKLTPKEFEIIKQHPTNGADILNNIYSKLPNSVDINIENDIDLSRKFIKNSAIIAKQHHEYWNGTGYPDGISHEKIHPYARIVALADVFDALLNKRAYKTDWTTDNVIEYIISKRNIQFDPRIIDIFIEHIDEFLNIQ